MPAVTPVRDVGHWNHEGPVGAQAGLANYEGTSQVIRFSSFEVDLQAQELRKGGQRLKLTGQPLQVPAILLERPGTVITREELQKRIKNHFSHRSNLQTNRCAKSPATDCLSLK